MTMPSGRDVWNERLRLIRFRVNNERSRFRDELRIIPRRLVWICVLLYIAAVSTTVVLNRLGAGPEGPPWDRFSPIESALASAGMSTAAALPAIAIILLVGYVNRDAKRRGMHSALWTLLVIILLPAWVGTGFIIYFLVREPLPYACPRCGETVVARFNYCPACMYNLHPTCPQCRREVRAGDHYCANCAADLTTAPISPVASEER